MFPAWDSSLAWFGYTCTLSHVNISTFCSLSQIMLALMDVQKPWRMSRDTVTVDVEEERERMKRETDTALVMEKLTDPCLSRLVTSLTNNRYAV